MPRGIAAINAIWRERQKAALDAQVEGQAGRRHGHLYDSRQPRVSAGHPDGGQWTRSGTGGDLMTAEGALHEAPQQGRNHGDLAQNQGPDSQTGPFNGFANPTPKESLENQVLFRECKNSQTGTLAPIGKYEPSRDSLPIDRYEFCTSGQLYILEKKVNDNSEEIKKMLIVGGRNGSDVFGHDKVTEVWARWKLAPGKRMTLGVDSDDNLDMAIR